jgi:hypothetical protein
MVETSKTIVDEDLLHQMESFVQENKLHMSDRFVQFYQEYVPENLNEQLSHLLKLWKEHPSYAFYKEYENSINTLIILIVFSMIGKLVSLFVDIYGAKQEELPQRFVLDKRYTEFETFPICTAKGDAEELLVLKSYEERHIELPDIDIEEVEYNISIVESPTPLNSIFIEDEEALAAEPSTHIHVAVEETSDEILDMDILTSRSDDGGSGPTSSSSEENTKKINSKDGSRNARSSSSEDSFEREEKLLDRTAVKMNEEKAYTPSKVSNHSFELSPSKKLVYKKSSSILTAFPSPSVISAETTVGDITQETVYSQGFSSEDSTPSSLRRH